MSLRKKFSPAFSADQQTDMLNKISKVLIENGVTIHSYQEALLVPGEPSKVDIRCAKKGSVVLDMPSSEHVRFAREVLNNKAERSRVSFAIGATGYPHGIVARPTEW